MTLIIILVCILIEQHLGPLEHLRQWGGFHRYADGLQHWLARLPGGHDSLGVVITLAPPIAVLGLLLAFMGANSVGTYIVAVVVLLYCLGPLDLPRELETYRQAVLAQDAERLEQVTAELTGEAGVEKTPQRIMRVLEAVLVAANDSLFAVFFWFTVLGPVGALFYRLATELRASRNTRAADYTAAAERLHDILNWVPARLFALGFALGGSLTHALEAWQFRRTLNFYENDNLIRAAGLGAMQFTPPAAPLTPEEEGHWIDEIRGLVGRTFLVWLTMLALITLAGIR